MVFDVFIDDDEISEGITAYISVKLKANPVYIRYSKSTQNPATASACVQKYLEVAYIVNDLLGTHTPQDWASAQGEYIKEVSSIIFITI